MNTAMQLPALSLVDWCETRDTIHNYARVLGKIRATLTSPQKHWWHVTLHVGIRGLTTTPMSTSGKTCEVTLDFVHHQLVIATSVGESVSIPLQGQCTDSLCRAALAAMASMGIECNLDGTSFPKESVPTYDKAMIEHYWRAISWIDMIFKEFKGGLRGETSPVHLFAHHFDLTLNWFSGRLVPGADVTDEEASDENMGFGFVTGDASVPEAYFYATAYPTPPDFTGIPLPAGAYWHTAGWSGIALDYSDLIDSENARATLFTFLRSVQKAGARLME